MAAQGAQGCVTQGWGETAQTAAGVEDTGNRAGDSSELLFVRHRFSVDAITYRRPGQPQDKQDNTEIAFGSETSHELPKIARWGAGPGKLILS